LKVISFFSFKGGVGRTALMANVGAYWALKGKTVLLIDMDLIAPGISYNSLKGNYLDPRGQGMGISDMLAVFARRKSGSEMIPFLPPHFLIREMNLPRQKFLNIEGRLLLIDAGSAIFEVQSWERVGKVCGEYTEGAAIQPIRSMVPGQNEEIDDLAFRSLAQYIRNDLSEFKIPPLNKDGYPRPIDYVLIDCRTGIPELIDLTLGLLSDSMVIISGLNYQNFVGMTETFKALDKRVAVGTLPCVVSVVFSPVPTPEDQTIEDALKRAYDVINKSLRSTRYDIPEYPPTIIKKIHYTPVLAFSEDILVIDQPDSQYSSEIAAIAQELDIIDDYSYHKGPSADTDRYPLFLPSNPFAQMPPWDWPISDPGEKDKVLNPILPSNKYMPFDRDTIMNKLCWNISLSSEDKTWIMQSFSKYNKIESEEKITTWDKDRNKSMIKWNNHPETRDDLLTALFNHQQWWKRLIAPNDPGADKIFLEYPFEGRGKFLEWEKHSLYWLLLGKENFATYSQEARLWESIDRAFQVAGEREKISVSLQMLDVFTIDSVKKDLREKIEERAAAESKYDAKVLYRIAKACVKENDERKDRGIEMFNRVVERIEAQPLLNIINDQVAWWFKQDDMKENKKWFYKFLLEFILPSIGFEMEKANRFELSMVELNGAIEKYCIRFSHDDFFLAFPDYKKFKDDLNVGECAVAEERIQRLENITKIISEELAIIVIKGNSYQFLHQGFRDFLAAEHILNEISIGLKKKEVAGELKERILPVYLRQYMGEIEKEHDCKPKFIKDQGWKIKENKNSLLYKAIALCRGCFDKSIGFAVWNIIETWKNVRGELSDGDLSRLDLSGVELNGIICSRFYKSIYLTATFDGALLHEKNILPQGHSDVVNSVLYSPNGKKFLSASDDKTIKEWDMETGECLKTFKGHSDWVMCTVYSLDSKKILSASRDNTVKEWDVETGECLKTFQGHSGQVFKVAYNVDGRKILSASRDNTIKVWDIETGECIITFQGHSSWVMSAVYSADGGKILSASLDHMIKEWDINSGECLKTFQGHSGGVESAVYSADGKKILSASDDQTIKEWDIATGECVKTFKGHSSQVNNAVYSVDGKKILSASNDQTIKEWDIETGKCLKTFQGNSDKVTSAVYNIDGKKILSSSRDQTIKEWDMGTGECLNTFRGYFDKVRSAVYSIDEKRILSASNNTIKEWDMETRKCLKIFQTHFDEIIRAVYSDDDKKVLSISRDRMVKEWDIETGEFLKTYKGDSSMLERTEQKEGSNKTLNVSGPKIYISNIDKKEPTIILSNIHGLFIQKCSFKNLHPGSVMSVESKALMEQYGAEFE